jgi:flavin reductase (DIM6/NTAB) family NADH-FMN oxidoreductase RutF
MPTDWNSYRETMRHFATGVAVLTVRDGSTIHGMTANSFASLSKEPMQMLVCIMKNSTTHELVTRSKIFALNILSSEQKTIAQRFAKQIPFPPDPFADIPHHREATGAPIFDECIAFVDCRVVAMHDGGDHTIFVGRVEAAGLGSTHENLLLWYNGSYHTLALE